MGQTVSPTENCHVTAVTSTESLDSLQYLMKVKSLLVYAEASVSTASFWA